MPHHCALEPDQTFGTRYRVGLISDVSTPGFGKRHFFSAPACGCQHPCTHPQSISSAVPAWLILLPIIHSSELLCCDLYTPWGLQTPQPPGRLQQKHLLHSSTYTFSKPVLKFQNTVGLFKHIKTTNLTSNHQNASSRLTRCGIMMLGLIGVVIHRVGDERRDVLGRL